MYVHVQLNKTLILQSALPSSCVTWWAHTRHSSHCCDVSTTLTCSHAGAVTLRLLLHRGGVACEGRSGEERSSVSSKPSGLSLIRFPGWLEVLCDDAVFLSAEQRNSLCEPLQPFVCRLPSSAGAQGWLSVKGCMYATNTLPLQESIRLTRKRPRRFFKM